MLWWFIVGRIGIYLFIIIIKIFFIIEMGIMFLGMSFILIMIYKI